MTMSGHDKPIDNVIDNKSSQPHMTQITKDGDVEKAILAALQKQNELLQNINNLIARSSEVEKEKTNNIRSRIVDIDMPLGSMAGFIFKWIIASIPVGIILGAFSLIISSCR